jgi:CRP-like cAMP-binding protein
VIAILKTIPLFSQLPLGDLSPLVSGNELYLKSYSKNATVYNHKDRCGTLDIVLSGSLVAYSLLESGSAMTMFEFSKGQILGANLLFGNTDAYPFTIYCLSDARILHVTKKAILELLRDYGFAMRFIQMLSDNSQKLNRKITMATQRTLRENLLEYLRQQSVLQRSNSIVLPISKKQLADYLGVQRPSLFRELKALKDERLIDVFNRTIQLHKPLSSNTQS